MTRDLAGKAVVVTGAATAIGVMIAVAWTRSAAVLTVDRRADAAVGKPVRG
jgi:NAD(P)-dependent dehydrogenase (short-subunit alcohol dehydrogenase family)